jgi:hypothetical protein
LRRARAGDYFDFTLRLAFAEALERTRSGNSAFPVERFHSSKVSGEILPLTNSSANFLRWALLLIGMEITSPRTHWNDNIKPLPELPAWCSYS